MWIFERSLGLLHQVSDAVSASKLFEAYSGRGEGLNNPKMQDVHNVGPLPAGFYDICAPEDSPTLGPCAMALIPHPANVMYGRKDFWLHGDNSQHDHTASEGCIVAYLVARQTVAASRDRLLQVI